MQFKVFGQNGRNLTRSAAILMVGALTAGCSSSVSRFDDFTDGLFTGSTENQRQIIGENQPFPGDAAASVPVNGVSSQPASGSGSVQRSALAASPGAAPALELPPSGSRAPNLLPAPTRATARPAVAAKPSLEAARDALVEQTPSATANKVAALPRASKLEEPAMASAEPRGASGGYTVVAGDTMLGIAQKTGVSAASIKQANGMSDGRIRIGQRLTIPGGASSQVASVAPAGETGKARAEARAEPAAYTPPAKSQKLVEQVALNASEEAPDATGIGRMRWPVRGRVVEGFGASGGGKSNDGIDIAVPEGTAVKAAENGVVIYAGDGLKEYGNTVLVRHEDGLVTVYGHASEIKVSRGDTVKRGQEIASSGMSGSAETPKLHFEVRKDSAPVNPSTFLE